MHKPLHRCAVFIVSVLLMLNPFHVHAQPDLPEVYVVELAGIEPPPPGIEAELSVGWGGGGAACDRINIHMIAGGGFSPAIQPKGFGLYMDCIEDVSVPLTIYFYEIDTTKNRVWHYIAMRSFYPAANHAALVQVKLARSLPIDVARIGVIVSGQPGSVEPRGGMWGITTFTDDQVSLCRDSLPPSFVVEEGAEVSRIGGLDLLDAPDPKGGVVVEIPTDAHVALSGSARCGSDGKTYWLAQYKQWMGWLPQGDLAVNWLVNEGELTRRSIVELCEDTLPSMLYVGQRARIAVVDGSPASMRMQPDGNVSAFTTIPELTPFTIVNGPWCGTNNRGEAAAYWLVRLDDGTKGWVIEVTPDIRVMEPIA